MLIALHIVNFTLLVAIAIAVFRILRKINNWMNRR